jgi:hypothetical protein
MNKRKRKKIAFFWIRVPEEYHVRTTGVPRVYPLQNEK